MKPGSIDSTPAVPSNAPPARRLRGRLALALGASLLCVSAQAHSLYSEATFQPLTDDRRAHRVGDVLTVLVYENASATASANTTAQKSSGLNVGVSADSHNHTAKVNLGEEAVGKGQIQRTGRVAAQLSVMVDSVLPNGDLRVAGRQEILVNGEKQLLQLAGRVRPIDISDANIVASTRIADAEITYVGDGILAEKQRQGLISRFFAWLGL